MAQPTIYTEAGQRQRSCHDQLQSGIQSDANLMCRGYQPVQSWAIMMKDGCTEIIVDLGKPARPVDAPLKSPLYGSAAVKMDLHVAGVDRYPLYLPKWTGDKDSQKHDE